MQVSEAEYQLCLSAIELQELLDQEEREAQEAGMITCVCSSCRMTASFDAREYRQAEKQGTTPLVCGGCGLGEYIPDETQRD